MNNYPVIWMHGGEENKTSDIGAVSDLASSFNIIGNKKGRGLTSRISKIMSNDLNFLGVGYVSAIGIDTCFLSRVTNNENKVGVVG